MDAVIRSHYQHVSLGYFQHQSIVRRYNWLKPAGTENVPLPFSFLANRGESTADRSRHNVTVSNDFRLLVKHTQIFIVLKVTRTQSSCPPTRKRGFSLFAHPSEQTVLIDNSAGSPRKRYDSEQGVRSAGRRSGERPMIGDSANTIPRLCLSRPMASDSRCLSRRGPGPSNGHPSTSPFTIRSPHSSESEIWFNSRTETQHKSDEIEKPSESGPYGHTETATTPKRAMCTLIMSNYIRRFDYHCNPSFEFISESCYLGTQLGIVNFEFVGINLEFFSLLQGQHPPKTVGQDRISRNWTYLPAYAGILVLVLESLLLHSVKRQPLGRMMGVHDTISDSFTVMAMIAIRLPENFLSFNYHNIFIHWGCGKSSNVGPEECDGDAKTFMGKSLQLKKGELKRSLMDESDFFPRSRRKHLLITLSAGAIVCLIIRVSLNIAFFNLATFFGRAIQSSAGRWADVLSLPLPPSARDHGLLRKRGHPPQSTRSIRRIWAVPPATISSKTRLRVSQNAGDPSAANGELGCNYLMKYRSVYGWFLARPGFAPWEGIKNTRRETRLYRSIPSGCTPLASWIRPYPRRIQKLQGKVWSRFRIVLREPYKDRDTKKTMYDFSGEPGSSELSIVTGEILTVTRTDVGEGWWEGTNQQGQTGLFPAAYVQFNNIQVYRRYKHFDWLHLRLREKYNIIPIPPLPDKQMTAVCVSPKFSVFNSTTITFFTFENPLFDWWPLKIPNFRLKQIFSLPGRYEEQFIEHRKNQLQTFVDCVCRHPVLSRSPVWEHFITCTDDKMWKIGKRKAEKDEFVGDMNFHTIEAPERIINNNTLEQEVSSCSRFVHNMDSAVKFLMDTSIDQTKKHMGHYKKEFQKIGQAFYAFGNAMQVDSSGTNGESLTRALKTVGDTYNDIGKMHEEQPKFDWEPLSDMLLVYKGILSSMPDILALHKKTQMKKKECEKLAFEQKMTPAQLESVSRRTDIVSYALLAEINYFYTDNAAEVTKSLKNFLQQQVAFHRKVNNQWGCLDKLFFHLSISIKEYHFNLIYYKFCLGKTATCY
ncbi:unnamed protein product [Nesidiocoris tenuis]|uniref:Sorting nexin n=1 Tax=Nesidiocoris tenuis TaxID=355587 RepID=A0A6H5H3W9_9HEMI|nr:unnamed protein product [Nesidiocoris tenuis]